MTKQKTFIALFSWNSADGASKLQQL